MKRALTLIIALLAVLMTGSTARAGYGDGGPPVIGASSAVPSAGAPLTLTIGNFHPETPVTFSIDAGAPSGGSTVIGSVTSDGAGSATISITTPSTAGTYTVTATDALGLSASLVITVAVSAPVPPSVTLPNTGGVTGVTLPNTGGDAGAGAVIPVAPVDVPLPATGTDLVPGLRIGATALVVGLALAGAAKLRRRSRASSAV